MHLVSWNVNGLRAVSEKGFGKWLMETLPDIVALQEIKSLQEDLEKLGLLELWSEHYNVHLNSAEKKGYSGTALFIKKSIPVKKVFKGIGKDKFDCEGRFIACECDDFYFLTGYFPNGKEDLSRVEYKLEFSRDVLALAKKLMKEKNVIITGDINTSHTEIDLARPKANIKNTGFLPEERVYIDELIQAGFCDVFRSKNPGLKDQYTWWSYRGGAREKNVGWRLDYFFANQAMNEKIKSVKHLTDIHGSDHCPIEIIF